MFNESPRTAKLIAGTLTVLAMGFGGIAMAEMPAPGSAGGAAMDNAKPGPQSRDGSPDGNNGFVCAGNNGVGGGNPAFSYTCDGSDYSTGSGSTNNGIGSGPKPTEPWVDPSA